MKITKRPLLILLCLALSTVAAGCATGRVSPTISAGKQTLSERQTLRPDKSIIVGTKRLNVVLANTPETQARGLAGIVSLADDQGMLFPFSPPTRPAFWMKGMLFSIDILWIKDNMVIGVTKHLPVPPSGTKDADLPQFVPGAEVTAALEVPAGWSDEHNIVTGSEIQF